MLEVEDQVRIYAKDVLGRVSAVGADEVIGRGAEMPSKHRRFPRRGLLALSAVVGCVALVLAGPRVFDRPDDAVVKTRPSTTLGEPTDKRNPAASLVTGKFATPELPPGFWRVRSGEVETGPMLTYSERFSPWDGDLRTYSTTPLITVATLRGDTSRYMENVRSMTEPIPTDRRDVIVRGRPAFLKVLHHELGDLITLVWVDVPGLAINVSGGGVTEEDVMRAAESLRAL